jgi:hypothetical protein
MRFRAAGKCSAQNVQHIMFGGRCGVKLQLVAVVGKTTSQSAAFYNLKDCCRESPLDSLPRSGQTSVSVIATVDTHDVRFSA